MSARRRFEGVLPTSLPAVARLAVLGFVGFVCASRPLHPQSIRTDNSTISVQALKYGLKIDRASGIVTLESPAHLRYTNFPLLAEAVPTSAPKTSPILSWEVHAPVVNMTARDPNSQQVFLKAALRGAAGNA